ncbi:MAG: hypothetical protein JWM34_4836 [Ilumatobacteraceae bacterium]|nr:hypothetical protein [Ilumatobacteraceae bacterium]
MSEWALAQTITRWVHPPSPRWTVLSIATLRVGQQAYHLSGAERPLPSRRTAEPHKLAHDMNDNMTDELQLILHDASTSIDELLAVLWRDGYAWSSKVSRQSRRREQYATARRRQRTHQQGADHGSVRRSQPGVTRCTAPSS